MSTHKKQNDYRSLLVRTGFGAIVGVMLGATAWAQPEVVNGSFEVDRYAVSPGYAGGNGGEITGWQWEGAVGLNPYYSEPETRAGAMAPFADNGRIPDGHQVALIQENGALWQEIEGFEKGEQYRIVFFENARHNNHPKRNPSLRVLLGDEVIVSKHDIVPVDNYRMHDLGYMKVTSVDFSAPRTGSFVLRFEAKASAAAVLLDDVSIRKVSGLNQ